MVLTGQCVRWVVTQSGRLAPGRAPVGGAFVVDIMDPSDLLGRLGLVDEMQRSTWATLV